MKLKVKIVLKQKTSLREPSLELEENAIDLPTVDIESVEESLPEPEPEPEKTVKPKLTIKIKK